MSEIWVGDGARVRFRVAARPGAPKTALVGLHEGALKVQVQAAPEKGKANKALLAFLSKLLEIPRRDLELVAGETSRQKTVEVSGLDAGELRDRLRRVLETP